MPTLRATVKSTLEADATLMTLLTGGIRDSSVLDFTGEGASQAPREADGITLKPHAVIRWGGSNPTGASYKVGAEAESVEVYVFQDTSYDVIESAIIRIRQLLHDTYLNTSDRALAHVNKAHISGEMPAEELGNAACKFIRFAVITAPT